MVLLWGPLHGTIGSEFGLGGSSHVVFTGQLSLFGGQVGSRNDLLEDLLSSHFSAFVLGGHLVVKGLGLALFID